jgi:hypothetical protein
VPTPANTQHVDERLQELYRRHLLVGEDNVANYYESGRGYYKPVVSVQVCKKPRPLTKTTTVWFLLEVD